MQNNISIKTVTASNSKSIISIYDLNNDFKTANKILTDISEKGINIDIFIINQKNEFKTDLSILVDRDDFDRVVYLINVLKKNIEFGDIYTNRKVSKVSIIGVGMKDNPGIASNVVNIIYENKVKILMLSCSEIKISVVIDEKNYLKIVDELKAYLIK